MTTGSGNATYPARQFQLLTVRGSNISLALLIGSVKQTFILSPGSMILILTAFTG
jgi:hypothetical protein